MVHLVELLQIVVQAVQYFFTQALDHRMVIASHLLQRTQIELLQGDLLDRLNFTVTMAGPLQGLLQIVQANRFEQALIHTGIEAAKLLLHLRVGGKPEDQARCPSALRFLITNGPRERVAVTPRHVAVGDHHIERLCPPPLQPGMTVLGVNRAMPQFTQLPAQQQTIDRMIVHHQNTE